MNANTTNERPVTRSQLNRLAEWSMRKPVIALMGEFSAGKSTLMNLLIGQNILPT
jgi:putative ribosome biogenesis GTPase RsgA